MCIRDRSYTRLIIEVGQSTSVQALVDNTGSLDGTVDATVYVVKFNGTKEVLQRPSIDIPAEGKGLISLDWVPTSQGIQWIEVELDNISIFILVPPLICIFVMIPPVAISTHYPICFWFCG